MTIYTKRGDRGETSLYSKDIKKPIRIGKDSLRISAIGAIDELNSFLGVVQAFCDEVWVVKEIAEVQRNLFTIGSILAGSDLRFSRVKTKKLERVIDELEGSLPVLKNFILPGGGALGSHLHFGRALARRAERAVVRLSNKESVKSEISVYLNRLSDYLFMLARKANFDERVKEEVWVGRKR